MAAHPVTPGGVRTEDVQGLLFRGYGRLRAAAYVVLEIDDGGRARAWLRTVLDEVTVGDARPTGTALNVAFTAAGLARLGLPPETLAGFSGEFLEGMAGAHRSRLLGDEGDAAPSRWAWGGPDGPEVHALLLAFAGDDDALAGSLARHREELAEHALREVAILETTYIGLGEHFGFRDGISQPTMAAVGRQGPVMHTLAPGELLLGHLNEHGQYPRSPLVPARLDPDGLLPERPRGPAGTTAPVPPDLEDGHDLGANGSYLVVRTLHQDVGGFWRYVDAVTRRPDGSSDVAARTTLAARMVGRWPSGAPLARAPDRDRPEIAEDNDFGYDAEDRAGTRCPLGAHVRRTNPRDALPPEPGTEASVRVGKRHRLLRRGRVYGPPIDPEDALTEDQAAAPDRGLHFVALCTDIARQFEFVSHTWAMNPHFAGLLDDADPLLGGHSGKHDSFTVQADPVRRRLTGLPAFVTPRGGAYFFLPGARALRFLARE